MKMSTAFPGAHFKAADLAAGPIVATIAAVAMGKVGDDTKPIMKFYEFEQDLVLNVTNANTLIEAFGDESAGWTGQQVQMYATKVQFGAEMVDAIRLTPVVQPVAGAPPAAVAYGAVPQQPVPGFAPPQLPVQQPAQPHPQTIQQEFVDATRKYQQEQNYPTAPPVPHDVLG